MRFWLTDGAVDMVPKDLIHLEVILGPESEETGLAAKNSRMAGMVSRKAGDVLSATMLTVE